MVEPEVTIGTERLFEAGRMSVRADRVRFADGSESTKYVIDLPEVAVIVAVDSDASLLLVRQYRTATGRDTLELPAGAMEPGERPGEAAQRELREETGHSASQLAEMGAFYSAPGTISELVHAILATGLAKDPLPDDDDERIVLELRDGKTLAALLLAERHLEAGT